VYFVKANPHPYKDLTDFKIEVFNQVNTFILLLLLQGHRGDLFNSTEQYYLGWVTGGFIVFYIVIHLSFNIFQIGRGIINFFKRKSLCECMKTVLQVLWMLVKRIFERVRNWMTRLRDCCRDKD
jgi:hypothetical protein